MLQACSEHVKMMLSFTQRKKMIKKLETDPRLPAHRSLLPPVDGARQVLVVGDLVPAAQLSLPLRGILRNAMREAPRRSSRRRC